MKDMHPDPTELAALGEDLLTPDEATTVRAHLMVCADCTATVAELELLTSELGDLFPVEPMPERVVSRIDRALADEAHRVSRETDPAADRGAMPETPIVVMSHHRDHQDDEARHPRARRGRRQNYLLAAVGAVVALGMGGLVLQAINGDGDSPVSAGADTGAEHNESELSQETIDSEDLESEVQELLMAPEAEQNAPSTDDGRESAPDQPGVPEADGSATTEGSPDEELTTQGGAPGETSDQSATPEADGEQGGTLAAGAAPDCVLAATGRAEPPIAVADHYEYEGVDSYVVVLPDRGDQDAVDVFVVDASCTESAPEETGVVLHADTYPRA